MYKGTVTPILREQSQKYFEKFGAAPDGYDEIYFDDMPHDKLLNLIKKALESDTEIPDLID